MLSLAHAATTTTTANSIPKLSTIPKAAGVGDITTGRGRSQPGHLGSESQWN